MDAPRGPDGSGRPGASRLPGWINCGTLLALFGVLVFVVLAVILVQILCYGPGGLAPTPEGRWTG